MDLQHQYNQRNPAVKRLMREACELQQATEEYFAKPLEDNLFEWHFTVHGTPGTEFEDGVYHGRIILPPEYPMKPPNIILLTPNGRFEVGKKICLSISEHHPESWRPSWSIRTALLALIAFMREPGQGSIGALDYTPEERKVLSKRSQSWICDTCGPIKRLLATASENGPSTSSSQHLTEEESDMLKCINLKAEEQIESSSPDDNCSPETDPSLQANSVEQNSLLSNQYDFTLYLIAFLLVGIAFLIARRIAITFF